MKTKFPSQLKLADISPIFKNLDNVLVENYRPVSILPIISIASNDRKLEILP